ncbi:MAG: tRNA epoxyqueuosine(34) reductase QueG [Bdellovibrionales bacterium RBG_16_40_8]|nr:MAG: tRNA epoxyqueuosine(34) reductase QueG [Bdellovibrionales bacterium RBG_16_40_8]
MYKSNVTLSAQQQVSSILDSMGFSHYGMAKLATPISLSFYKSWLENEYHGDMEYLRRHLPQKENPIKLLPHASSAIVIGFNYLPHPKKLINFKRLRVAEYAAGEDYHIWLKEHLDSIAQKLKEIFPQEEFLSATDSRPILERDLAYRAGLGWVGKNTCVIHQKHGSFFLIGEILTTLDLYTTTVLHPDRCGSCNKCIEACPTKALISPLKLDARLCISYLTIESKKIPPLELRRKIGNHFFGCDICQSVCPWNIKIFEANTTESDTKSQYKNELVSDLRFILHATNSELMKHFANSPLSRARGFGLKRNALIVAANQNIKTLRPEIVALTSDPRLGELAQWALQQLLN